MPDRRLEHDMSRRAFIAAVIAASMSAIAAVRSLGIWDWSAGTLRPGFNWNRHGEYVLSWLYGIKVRSYTRLPDVRFELVAAWRKVPSRFNGTVEMWDDWRTIVGWYSPSYRKANIGT